MSTDIKETTPIFKKGKLYRIPLAELAPDPGQPRKYIDDTELHALKQSIEVHGLLSPIIFRVDENKNLILVSGERRYRACQLLGKPDINGIFLDTEKYDEIALVDNVQRADLHPVDEAEAVHNLKVKYAYTQEQIGNIVGKAQNTISDILGMMALSDEIRNDARGRKGLSRGALLKVARIKRPASQKKAYDALTASLSMPKKEIKRPRLTIIKKAITSTENTLKCIKSMDLDKLGDDRDAVVSKLQELLQEVQNKLDSIEG